MTRVGEHLLVQAEDGKIVILDEDTRDEIVMTELNADRLAEAIQPLIGHRLRRRPVQFGALSGALWHCSACTWTYGLSASAGDARLMFFEDGRHPRGTEAATANQW
jgi:hypothetical protein